MAMTNGEGLGTQRVKTKSSKSPFINLRNKVLSIFFTLRCQGAMVVTIKPEHLLSASDYYYYTSVLNKESTESTTIPTTDSLHSNSSSTSTSTNRYEFLSRKAWTDLLLQVVKVSIDFTCFEW